MIKNYFIAIFIAISLPVSQVFATTLYLANKSDKATISTDLAGRKITLRPKSYMVITDMPEGLRDIVFESSALSHSERIKIPTDYSKQHDLIVWLGITGNEKESWTEWAMGTRNFSIDRGVASSGKGQDPLEILVLKGLERIN